MKGRMIGPNGVVKKVKAGFSWTTLFFGFFVPLFRGDFKWFLFCLLCDILVLPWLIFPFIYNKIYIKELLERGYKPEGALADRLREKGIIAASAPQQAPAQESRPAPQPQAAQEQKPAPEAPMPQQAPAQEPKPAPQPQAAQERNATARTPSAAEWVKSRASEVESKYEFLKFKVAGVTFKNGRKSRQTILRRMKFQDPPYNKGVDLSLKREEYEGKPAFGVYANDEQIGFVPADLVEYVDANFSRIDQFTHIDVYGGGEGKNYGAEVILRLNK